MYLPYLMLGYAAAILLTLVGCRIAVRALPGLLGMRLLSWGLGAAFAGMLLFALLPVVPLWVTAMLGNSSILLYALLYLAALAQCLGVRSRVGIWGTGLFVAQLALHFFFAYNRPSLLTRFLVTTLVPLVCAVAAAVLLFRQRSAGDCRAFRSPARCHLVNAMAWLQVLITTVAVVRALMTALRPPSQVMELDLVQSAFTYLNLLLNLSAAAALIWLAFLMNREELYTRANTDGLTGILNRRAFDEILARELNRANAGGRSVPVMMADIDFFKRVNDTLGHPAGDEVLRQVAGTLLRTLRPADVVSRFGGEEFAILLRETKPRQAPEAAERLRTAVAAITGLPSDIRVTVSIGLAGSLPGEALEELIARCDQALYCSKREGRNRVSIAADTKGGEPSVLRPGARFVQTGGTQRSA
jgi:diguanylate cyclase (GGDEF)-like protein